MAGGCPFSTSNGFSTVETRKEYLEIKKLNESAVPDSLDGDLDTTKPLYYWQLYSIIGEDPIFDICTDFYNSVFADEDNPWFRRVFEKANPKKRHIYAQVGYWLDTMGAGQNYPGGSGRLSLHHYKNADQIMNAKGAKHWMYHMKIALKKNHHHFQRDPRVLPCLVDFLETKMKSYADLHDWEFDDSDFKLEDFCPDD